jgi:hypothetical protein
MLKSNHVSENITIQPVPQNETPDKEFSLAGHTIIAKEEVPNPLGGFFPNQAKLLFSRDSDGIEVIKFGCNFCLTILPTSQGVGIHIGRVHNDSPKQPTRGLDPIEAIERAVAILKEKKSVVSEKEYEKLVAERDHWKREALKAKRRLEQIRSAISPNV